MKFTSTFFSRGFYFTHYIIYIQKIDKYSLNLY